MRTIPRAPYLAAPVRRLAWLQDLERAGLHPRVVRGPRRHRRKWCVQVRLDVPGVGLVAATLCLPWDAPEAVVVVADAPSDSPHRYAGGELCMWFPADDSSRRWTRHDGIVALAGHVVLHLAREEWWRRTGEWAGDEAPHLLRRRALR